MCHLCFKAPFHATKCSSMRHVTDSLTKKEQATWKTFLTANVRLMEQLDHDLQTHSLISITDYEILEALAKAPDQKLRMSELADKVLVSRSRLTYRVDRLTNVDYIEREECEDDRRGLWATLTTQGSDILESARPNHTNDIRKWFFDNLDESETETVDRVLQRITQKLEANI